MAVIKITNFAGEAPSLSARSLGVGFSALAKNLYARVGEFRPLQDDAVVVPTLPGGASNPKTLFRLERKADGTLNTDMTTGWITSDKVMSYAKGQINDDMTGRTYYSFDDGSAPPRVMDAGINPARDGMPVTAAVNKPLGVPPPGKPMVTALLGNDFTYQDYEKLVQAKELEVATAVRKTVKFGFIGYDMAGAGIPGFINRTVTGITGVPGTIGSTPTQVNNPNNPAGPSIPSTSTTGGTPTTSTGDFTIGGGNGAPVSGPSLIENVVLTGNYKAGFGQQGLVASIPAEGGGATGFVDLSHYRTFTMDGFTYDRVQFEAWLKEQV